MMKSVKIKTKRVYRTATHCPGQVAPPTEGFLLETKETKRKCCNICQELEDKN